MVESKFITELPEHKSDTNYFGLDSTAAGALLGYCDEFYELLKETELGNTGSPVKLLPCRLERSALRSEEGKKLTNSENRAVLETCIKAHLFFNQSFKSVYLKLSPVTPACSTFLKCNRGLFSPPFFQIRVPYCFTSLSSGSFSWFNIGMQVQKPKEIKKARNLPYINFQRLPGSAPYFHTPGPPSSPKMPHLRTSSERSSRTGSASSAGAKFTASCRCGSARRSAQPRAPLQPAGVTNQFLWFSASQTSARTSPHGLKAPFPFAALATLALSRAAQRQQAGLPSSSHFSGAVHYLQLSFWRFCSLIQGFTP